MNFSLKYNGHPALHTVAEEVEGSYNIYTLLQAMWRIMETNDGVGLAANQVGELKRVIVINANGFKQEFINPVIVKGYGGTITSREGCLSFRSLGRVTIIRHKQIIVEAFDRDFKPIRRKLKGLAACALQHEVDHLNGITIQTHMMKISSRSEEEG